MAIGVSVEPYEGQDALTLESDQARVVLLPRIGGKIASVVDKETKQELLWRTPDRAYRAPTYGSAWATSDMGGWEDCLPTVAACPYPVYPWQDIPLPEQGEVWALPWEARVSGEDVTLSVQGIRLPYRFEKRISLEGKRILLRHRITNPSAFPLSYLWATHPLLRIRPGVQIVLPPDARVRLEWSRGDRLGTYLDHVAWPVARDRWGGAVRIDQVGDATLGWADKLYASVQHEGWCGMHDPETRQTIALSFDPRQLPYIGVWINQGGWPLEGPACYNLALEPTNGYPDLLSVAHTRGTAALIEPGADQEWEVQCCFGCAPSVQALLGHA